MDFLILLFIIYLKVWQNFSNNCESFIIFFVCYPCSRSLQYKVQRRKREQGFLIQIPSPKIWAVHFCITEKKRVCMPHSLFFSISAHALSTYVNTPSGRKRKFLLKIPSPKVALLENGAVHLAITANEKEKYGFSHTSLYYLFENLAEFFQ